MHNKSSAGHAAALFTVAVWGTTFLTTKGLLAWFSPAEILLLRLLLALGALTLIYPHPLRGTTMRQELTFAAAGLSGVVLYQLLENTALTYTRASNVSVILSAVPFFTALCSHLLGGEERLTKRFFLGFAVAMTGICLISFNGIRLQLNPLGDLIALCAGLLWCCYAMVTRNIGSFGYHNLQTTRRIFLYAVLFMIPTSFLAGVAPDLSRLADPVCLGSFCYLGLCASALCFSAWNWSVQVLGPVTTSVYVYLIPAITLAASVLLLGEEITPLSALGTLLAISGLFISQSEELVRLLRGRKERGL